MLGTAQTDSLGTQLAGVGRVLAGVGVRAHGQLALAHFVAPLQDGLELLGGLGRRQCHFAQHDLTGGAVQRDDVALFHHHGARGELLALDPDRFGAHHGGGAPAARHHGRVADQTATSGENALRHHHSVNVLGTGLAANQDDLLATIGRIGGIVGREIDLAHRGTRRRGQTLGDHLLVAGFELWVQHLVEVLGGHAGDGFFLADLPDLLRPLGSLGHVDGHAKRRGAGALAHAGLQHPQLALLDRELGVAHVGVVRLEAGENGQQLLVNGRELRLQRVEVLGVPDTGHHVLALSVDEEVTVRNVLTRGRVAGEAHAGARVVVAIAEHHGLHVHGGAQIVRDLLANAVRDGPRAVPALEHGLDGPAQLLVGGLRERLAGFGLHDREILRAQALQRLRGQLRVGFHTGRALGILEGVLEVRSVDTEHDASVHRDESAIGVVGEALVTRDLGETLHALIVETEVEDRVHHARHGELRARTHADEQRILRITQLALHRLLEFGDLIRDLGVEALRPTRDHVITTGVGGDGEPRRNRQLEHARHLGEVGSLAAEQILHLHRRTTVFVIERVDVRHEREVYEVVSAPLHR